VAEDQSICAETNIDCYADCQIGPLSGNYSGLPMPELGEDMQLIKVCIKTNVDQKRGLSLQM